MKRKLALLAALISLVSFDTVQAADKKETPKKATADSTKKSAPKAKQDTYPLYGKVVAITSRTLTIVRSDSAEAQETKFTVNASTQYVDEDKPVTIEAVKVGAWIGGSVKKAEGDGNDTVVKLNVGVKQKAAAKKGAAKATKKKADDKKKAE